MISAQVSIYPLRQARLGPGISKAIEIFRNRGLIVRPESMSTLLMGDPGLVFDSLKEAFQASGASGEVVMVVTLSNACVPATES